MRKLLNINPRDSDYSADTDDGDDIGSDSETEGALTSFLLTPFLMFWIIFPVFWEFWDFFGGFYLF